MRVGDAGENSGKTGDGKNWGQTEVPRQLGPIVSPFLVRLNRQQA
jgi:hypothetical protein